MALIRKQIERAVEKSEEGKPVVFKITTEDPDRMDDVIRLDGWKLDAFQKNPVVLFNHDRDKIVARAAKVWRESGALKAEIEFAPTEEGAEKEKLVRGGFLNAASVGFWPSKYGPRKDHDGYGLEYQEQELLEFSLVSVPCNSEALVEQRSLRDSLRKQLETTEPKTDPAAPVPDEASPPDAASSPGAAPSPELPSDEPKADAAPEQGAASQPPDAAPEVNAEESKMLTAEQLKSLFDGMAAMQAEMKSMKEHMEKPATNKGAEISGAPAVHASKRLEGKVDPCREELADETDPRKGKGMGLSRSCVAAAFAANHKGMTVSEAAHELGFRKTADMLEKALGESTIGAGGSLVHQVHVADFIDLMRPETIARANGAVLLRFQGGSATIPKKTGGSSASFVGESQSGDQSEITFGEVNAHPKKMRVEVVASNQLIRNANSNIDQLIRDDMLQASIEKEDLVVFEGKGGEYVPSGLVKLIPSANTAQATGSADLTKATADLEKLLGFLEDNNVPSGNAGYFGHPKHFRGLRGFPNGIGGYPFREEMKAGTLNGLKTGKSSQLNTTGANSRFYCGDFRQTIIAENMDAEITTDTTYTLANGTVVSASSKDQTVMRLWRMWDFLVRYEKAFGFLHTVTW